MKISVVGAGYVGLVSASCFAELGNHVICVDNDSSKIKNLKKLKIPIYEPGLDSLIKRNVKERRLTFSNSIKDAVSKSEVIFIAVGTPPRENGEADLSGIENVARGIARAMNSYRLIVEKSTVPVETGAWVEHTIKINISKKVKFDIASNPEFLREGHAIDDFMHPDRIVIGVNSKKAEGILVNLYKPIGAPIVVTDIKSAELIKHASNSYLATKISFINAVSQICELTGADIKLVAEGMGLDKRIGKSFLNPGVGYGGSCFPKDLDAFVRICEKYGYDFRLLKNVKEINEKQKDFFVNKIKDTLWILKDKLIGVLGISFKPNTDDIRQAPALDIINRLIEEGASVQVFDPQAMAKAKDVLGNVKFCKDPYEAARKSDCLVILTEWDEFKELDFKQLKKVMRHPLIIDGRNIYDPGVLKRLGFRYVCIGRPKI